MNGSRVQSVERERWFTCAGRGKKKTVLWRLLDKRSDRMLGYACYTAALRIDHGTRIYEDVHGLFSCVSGPGVSAPL